MFPQKIVGDYVRYTLAAPEVAPDLAHQLRLIAGTLMTQGIVLDILIEQFLRVELRTITLDYAATLTTAVKKWFWEPLPEFNPDRFPLL